MGTEEIIGPFLEVAQSYLDENRVVEIIFSRSTYHIQVLDQKTQDPNWAFIQLGPHNRVKDSFCSCQVDTMPTCEHLAAAILKIFSDPTTPLHQRFEHSFFKHIFFAFAKAYGFEKNILTKKENQYLLKKSKSLLLSIIPKDEKAMKSLNDFIDQKQKETEETSLKFSNLPKKELELWKQGHPSEEFRFELSFWSDLAKWLFLKQDNKDSYKIKISTSNHIPSKIKITFSSVELFFALSLDILKEIIPYLNTVESPLKVHENALEEVEQVLYDPKEKSLEVFPKKVSANMLPQQAEGKQIGDWIFLAKKGFYLQKPKQHFRKKEKILSHHIDDQLEKNAPFFKKHLKNTQIDIQPISPKYEVFFDNEWNLNINLYLFEKDDLSLPHSVFFGHWIFLEGKGFFRLKETPFQQPSLFIPREQVSTFIHQYRSWLNLQKGFEVHLASVQTQLTYTLNEHKQLIFSSHLSLDTEASYDFGDWVYVQDQGFYTKARYSSPIGHGMTVRRREIARFIHLNKEDLEAVPNFFNDKCPVERATVALRVDEEMQEIIIEPKYYFYPEYLGETVMFFEDFSFVQGRGFYQLPKNLLLPKGFRKKVRVLPHEQASFLALQFPKLKPFISHVDPKIRPPKNLKLVLQEASFPNLKLAYQSQSGEIDIFSLYEAFQLERPYFFSEAGLINLNHPRFSWIHGLKKEQFVSQSLKLNSIELIRIEAIDQAFRENPDDESILDQINSQVDLSLPNLKGFQTKLRPYQEIGLKWLWRLFRFQLSGILCDDMGLGKTLQSMALIALCKNEKRQRPHPGYKMPKKKFLIVCPTSVIYHWQDKLKEFYPKLNILTFYGLNRSMKRFQQKFDVLLTSYGILRIDQKQIAKIDFTLAIYDEIQVAKNHRSLTYSALRTVEAKMKLGLTGTPIENNLRELKALMDLVVPNYLPNEEEYRDFFINPIEKEKDENKIKILRKMIEPFTLRRKKEDVLKELPKKIEQLSHCELSSDQAKLYNFYLNQSKEKLLKELKDNSKPIPYMHIFSLLTKLKQVCNHPKSIDPEKYKDAQSGKWDLFVELLNEAKESGQKVVVFTQYLNMMDLIENHLKENLIGYASIRGSTKERGKQLKKFKEDSECTVFVGSLKAVGLGVDLTSASIVIHYDRWWNAARENQATDRVHRMGQQRGVQVFKMVTLNTLEEKIDQIIRSKGKLMEDIVGTSDQDQIKSFSRQDLIDILQFVEKDIYENS